MKGSRTAAALVVAPVITLAALTGSAGAATTHPTYALGHAKTCRVHYVKRTERHEVNGKVRRYVGCVYVAPAAPVKTADPPTSVGVASSDNPATTGDTVTYTVTVADVLSSTSGTVTVLDNGAPITGCSGLAGSLEPNGSLVATCSTSYQAPTSDLIVGTFSGDQTYAQSAGQLTETVNAPVVATVKAPVTLAPTTTTVAISVSQPGCTTPSGPTAQCTYRVTVTAVTASGNADVSSDGSYQWTIGPQDTTTFNVTINENGTAVQVSANATWSGSGYQSSSGSATAQVGPASD